MLFSVVGERRTCETLPVKESRGKVSYRELRRLSLVDAADVGLVDVDLDLHLREVARYLRDTRRLVARGDVWPSSTFLATITPSTGEYIFVYPS